VAEHEPGNAVAVPGGGIRFDKRTLSQWFREMDRADSGIISRRQLIVALRQRPEYQAAIFCRTDSGEAQHEENARIIGILKDIEGDGCGNLKWDDFILFFRRAGLLLEYHMDRDLDDTELSTDIEKNRAGSKKDAANSNVSEALASEIRTRIGISKESRFRTHRRAGSPVGEAPPPPAVISKAGNRRASLPQFLEKDGLLTLNSQLQ